MPIPGAEAGVVNFRRLSGGFEAVGVRPVAVKRFRADGRGLQVQDAGVAGHKFPATEPGAGETLHFPPAEGQPVSEWIERTAITNQGRARWSGQITAVLKDDQQAHHRRLKRLVTRTQSRLKQQRC